MAQWSQKQSSSSLLFEILKLHGILHEIEYCKYGEFHILDCRDRAFQILYCKYKKLIVQQNKWKDDSTRIYWNAYDDTILQNDFTSFFKINIKEIEKEKHQVKHKDVISQKKVRNND